MQQLWKGKMGAGSSVGVGPLAGEEEEAPYIIAVCRNVHANTPYYVWQTVLHKIFQFRSKVTFGRFSSLRVALLIQVSEKHEIRFVGAVSKQSTIELLDGLCLFLGWCLFFMFWGTGRTNRSSPSTEIVQLSITELVA